MNQILTFLRGKKTYILVACGLAVSAFDMTGMITDNTANTALAALGFGSLATLRAGIVNALAQAKLADAPAASAPAAAPAPVPPAAA